MTVFTWEPKLRDPLKFKQEPEIKVSTEVVAKQEKERKHTTDSGWLIPSPTARSAVRGYLSRRAWSPFTRVVTRVKNSMFIGI